MNVPPVGTVELPLRDTPSLVAGARPTAAGAAPDLSRLLAPRSIAVIGASDQPGNLGGVAVGLLGKFGYAGDVWPVNPGRSEVGRRRCFADLGALPGVADLAIIATGAASLPQHVRSCAAAGIRFGIAWAGGFAETGAAGAALQVEVGAACAETGFTLVGPNCIGIVNTGIGMTATFASFLLETDRLLDGDIAIISQSGGMATMAQALAQRAGFGFRYMISSGNEAVLSAADYVHFLAGDPDVKVIALYIEGVRDGEKFVAAVEAARAAGKPVVVLKGGLTAASARAAAAHTGAFAGEARVWSAIARENGLVTVKSLEELLDVALFLSSIDLATLPKGPGLAAVSFGGGTGVLSADQAATHGLSMATLTEATRAALKPLVPPIASIENPIDLTPQAFNQESWFGGFGKALDVIAADPGVDIVLCQFGPMARRGIESAAEIAALRHRTGKTVCIAWPLAPPGVDDYLATAGVHVFHEYERAIAVLGKLVALEPAPPGPAATPATAFDWAAAIASPRAGLVVSEHECHSILRAAGLPVAAGRLAAGESDAVAAAREIGLPVAMKGISPAVTHRAAAGLVALDLRTTDDVASASRRLAARAAGQGIALDGVYVQAMLRGGVEIIVSAFRDPIFGVMISCGAGGVITEIIDDFALARAPLEEAAAARLLQRLRIVRGAAEIEPEARLADLARFVADFSQLAAAAPWQQFVIELNPVKWRANGAVAVDGLILVEQA